MQSNSAIFAQISHKELTAVFFYQQDIDIVINKIYQKFDKEESILTSKILSIYSTRIYHNFFAENVEFRTRKNR